MDPRNYFHSQSNSSPAYPTQSYPGSQHPNQVQIPQPALQRSIMPIQIPYPNPNHLGPYNDSVNQVYRWANWVKFVAVFIMLRSLLSILGLIIQISFAHDDIQTNPFVSQIFILLFLLFIGYIGYRASVSKTSASAKFYIFCLLAYGIVELIWVITSVDNFMDFLCEESVDIDKGKTGHTVKEGKRCPDSFYNTVMAVCIGVFLFVYVCVCTPIMLCICKMYSHAKVVESQNVNRYKVGQNFHTFRFNQPLANQMK